MPKTKKTRNNGQWSESRFWSFVRAGLRKQSMKWPPKNEAKKAARRPSKLEDKRTKWEYQCAMCKKWFKGSETQVDHIEECGSLKCAEDLPKFVTTLFCEIDNLQVLCKPCHKKKGK